MYSPLFLLVVASLTVGAVTAQCALKFNCYDCISSGCDWCAATNDAGVCIAANGACPNAGYQQWTSTTRCGTCQNAPATCTECNQESSCFWCSSLDRCTGYSFDGCTTFDYYCSDPAAGVAAAASLAGTSLAICIIIPLVCSCIAMCIVGLIIFMVVRSNRRKTTGGGTVIHPSPAPHVVYPTQPLSPGTQQGVPIAPYPAPGDYRSAPNYPDQQANVPPPYSGGPGYPVDPPPPASGYPGYPPDIKAAPTPDAAV